MNGLLPANRRRSPFTRAQILADPGKLLNEFHSVGETCGFGFVQRKFGVDQIGLLRWAGVPYAALMQALENDFAGVGDPANTRFELWDNEYVVLDTRYGFLTHTWITPEQVAPERFLETACTRLRFMVRKFREDASGERILLRAAANPVPPARVRALHAALRRYGPNVLLHLTQVGDGPGADVVEWLDDGLMVGGIRDLGYTADGRWLIDFGSWVSVCRKAFVLFDEVNRLTLTEGEAPDAAAGQLEPAAPAVRIEELVAEVAADRRPASALLRHLRALEIAGGTAAAALGTALFESIFYRLPAFPDDELLAVAGRLYGRTARPDPASLLASLACQSRPLAGRPAAPEPADDIAARAAATVASANPGGALLLALESFERTQDWRQSARLFEAVWPRVLPLVEYWVYYRMIQVYDALGRDDAAVLLATLAIQIEPQHAISDMPHRRLLRHFRAVGRLRDAAELCVRRRHLCPEPALLLPEEQAALLASAGTLLLSPAPAGRTDRSVAPREVRTPRPWPLYGRGLPRGFDELLRDMERPEITVAEVAGAEVLIDGGAVAVFGPDGVPHLDLSVRSFPALVRARHAGQPVEELHLDEAVLLSDEFPDSNLCHFMLDHATRIELYRRAGAGSAAATVIGLDLRHEYQRVIAERLGIRAHLPVFRRARVHVGRLLVSSNCHNLRHPGHWSANWAVAATRALFDLVPRLPARRLLVSRADSQWRRIGNHDAVAALLAPLGFEVIVPGRMPFAAQVAAFRDATHVVSPHGAGLANMLFCAPGTQVLEVFHPHYGTWAYAMLNAALGVDYASMVGRDAESDAPEFNDLGLPREQTVPHAGRDMRVDMDELRRWLTASRAW